MEEANFRGRLRDEIIAAQQTRASLVREKLMFVVGALGVGTVSSGWLSNPALLYLVPLVATIFDLYIAGEDFHVKRIGGFLGAPSPEASKEEGLWEALVGANPDRFSQVANPATSLFAIGGAAWVVWPPEKSIGFWIWLVGFPSVVAALWTVSLFSNRRIRQEAAKRSKESQRIESEPIETLKSASV